MRNRLDLVFDTAAFFGHSFWPGVREACEEALVTDGGKSSFSRVIGPILRSYIVRS
jgi:hypothetical protein